MQYERTQLDLYRGSFRVRGDVLEVHARLRGPRHPRRVLRRRDRAHHALRPAARRRRSRSSTGSRSIPRPTTSRRATRSSARSTRSSVELAERLAELRGAGQAARAPAARAAHPLRPRDAAARSATATASRTTRATSPAARPGEPPPTLLDYFPDDFLLVVDESHQTMPQVRGMYHGDRSRKQTLVDFGFRLPCALDNRPLTFEEFDAAHRPAHLRLGDAGAVASWSAAGGVVVEQVIRPDRPARSRDRGAAGAAARSTTCSAEIRQAIARRRARAGDHAHQAHGRGADAVPAELGLKVRYLHSDIETLERVRDHHRAAARRVRRAGRHQPAARGPRPARGVAGGDPRRRQGGLPAQRDRR